MSDAAKAEGAAETEAATKSASAHRLDTTALNDQRRALDTLTDSAKRSQQWTEWGGRNDPGAHLSDMAKTLEYKRLINIQNWLTFTNPQSAFAFREKERQQAIQMNYAVWGGYTTPDQYLGYLQRQRSGLASLNDVLLNRAQIYRDNASAALSYENALSGTHATAGTLSEHLDLSGISQFQSALAGLPDVVTTRLAVDDATAISDLAKYRALLKGVPREVSTSEVLTAATALGGVALDQKPQVIPVSYGGPYQHQFAAIMAEVAALSKLHAQIPVSFELPSAAEVARFVSQIPTAGITEPVHLVPQGGAVGVGPGPPPETIAAWKALSGAESGAVTEAKLASSAESAAGDAAAGAVPKVAAAAAAWEALRAAEKDAAAAAAAGGAGGGKPPAPPPAAAAAPGEEPPSDAAGKWAALSDAEKAAATEADLAAVKFAALKAAAAGDATAASHLAYVYQTLGGNTKNAGAEAEKSAGFWGIFGAAMAQTTGKMIGATAGWAGLNTQVKLFGGILPGVLAGVAAWHLWLDAIVELLAIAVPAVVGVLAMAAAVGIFIGVASQAQDTLGRISDRLKAVQVASQATGQAIYPMTNAFDKLAKVIRPEVWQLYGDALNLVSQNMGRIGGVAVATGHYLDMLAAKFIVWVTANQAAISSFIRYAVQIAQEVGHIGLVLGNALFNFIKVTQDTHIAEYLLNIVGALAQLLDWVSKLPTPLLALVLGLHGAWLWGGLLANVVIKLLDPLRALSLALGGVAAESTAFAAAQDAGAGGWAKLKAVISDIGLGLSSLAGRFGLTGGAAKAAAVDLSLAGDEAALMSGEEVAATATTFSLAGAFRALGASMLALLANPLTWLVAAAAAIGIVAYKIFTANDNTQKWITGMDQALAKSSVYQVIGKTVSDLAAVTQQLAAAQKTGAGNASELAAAQTDLSGKLKQELVHVGQVSKAYGVDMPGALDLLQVAGVKTDTLFTQNNKTWAAAMVQVAGLVQGYAAMGQGLTQLQGDVSVQLVMNADQLKQMGALNTAWDSWLKLVVSGPSAFVAFEQGVQTVTTNMKAAGASFGGTNAASLTLRASWDSLIPAAGNVLDAVRSYSAVLQNGAAGTALLNRATKDVIASSGQMSTTNQDVRNSLIAVAEQANPAINTWQKLTQWIGPLGAAKATSDLDKVMTLLQTPVTNLQKDAALLTTTLQQDLNPAMATATFNALGGQKAFNTFATDLTKFGPNAKPTIDAAHNVAVELISIDKNTKTAHDQFVTWAESMGMSKDAANKLWAEVSKGVTPINAVRDGLAKSATASDNLDKSGFFAGLKDRYVTNLTTLGHFFTTDIPNWAKNAGRAIAGIWDDGAKAFDAQQKTVNHFFTVDIPNWAKNIGGAFSTAWGTAYNGFQRDLAGPLTAWWTQSFPHALSNIGGAFSTAWGTAYNGFQRDLAGPLTAWWTQSFPHAFSVVGSAFSTAWGTAYNGFQRDLAGPITHWATVLLPASFAGQALKAAWSTVYTSFQRDLAGPLTAWFTKTLPGYLDGAGRAWNSTWSGAWTAFVRDVWDPFSNFFTKTIPGLFSGAGNSWNGTSSGMWSSFVRNVWNPFSGFFTKTVPGFFDTAGRQWNSMWSTGWTDFVRDIWTPFSNFFTKTIPSWFGGTGTSWGTLWSNAWSAFSRTILQPFLNFFTKTIPGWFGGTGTSWGSLWSNAWSAFVRDIWNPFSGFFTRTVPGFFDGVGRAWNSMWSTGWTDFYRDIITPMANWFSRTLPSLISSAVKGGINAAIGYINDAINIINAVTHIVGIPAIGRIGTVAAAGGVMPARMAAGSIPGTGDEDGTHIIAMGGEYMLRKPARMALEAKYGRGYMDYLNQADTWLGAGSRGNTASQQPPHGARRMASGGNADPVGGWARPERIDQGVDYGGAGPLYAISHGTITNLYNAGWPGGTFIGLRMDQGAQAGKYWYYAEDIAPNTHVGATVNAGDHIANATGGGSGIEIGFAAPPGSGLSMASATGETKGGAVATGWGVAASNFIKSLGGPGGVLSGAVSGGTPGISGGFSAIWQNILGLLDAAGGSVTGAVAALGKYVSGGAGALLNLAKSGSRALFDGVWSGGIDPIINKATPGGTSIPGSLLKYSAAEIKAGVDALLGAKDAAAQSSAAASNSANAAGTPGPGGGSAAANAALAQKLMPAWGSGTEWLAWNALEMAEAGWNQYARNPSSGAYGIPQALPPSKMGAAANPPQSNPTAQINWMISYIKSVYGDPIGANRHENMFHWYAPGGPVGLPSNAGLVGLPSKGDPGVYDRQLDGPNLHPSAPGNATLGDMWMNSGGLQQLTGLGGAPYDLPAVQAAGGPVGYAQGDVIASIEAATTNQQIREALALGSYLESGWNDTAVGDSGTSFGPYQIHLPAHPGVNASEAENPAWASKFMLPAYTTGVNQTAASLWKTNAVGAAANAAYLAERPAKTYYASQGATAVNTGWAAVLKALGPAPVATVTVPKTAGGSAGAAHNALVAAGLVPTDPNAGIKGEAGWPVAGTTPAAGTTVAAHSRVQINALSPVSSPSPAGTPGMTPTAAWAYYSSKLGADANAEVNAFWDLQLNSPLPSPQTTFQQWESDYAWLLILRGQQARLMNAWNTVNTDLGTPGSLGSFAGAQDWAAVADAAATLESWTGGSMPPQSYWKDENLGAWPAGYPVGHITPYGWASWKYQNANWTKSSNTIDKFKTDLIGAEGAWNALYGPSGSISTSAPTPGVQAQPAGNTGPIVIDLQSLITGGAYAPVSAVSAGIPLSATGSGFAAGGPMPSISMAGAAAGGEVSMADVANMFAMGGSIPVLPARSGPQGLVGSLDRMQNGQGNARTVTSSAGDSIGVSVGNLTINNPVAEKPSDSITRSSNRLAFLAGRGVAL